LPLSSYPSGAAGDIFSVQEGRSAYPKVFFDKYITCSLRILSTKVTDTHSITIPYAELYLPPDILVNAEFLMLIT